MYTPSKVALYAHIKTQGSSCPQCRVYSKRMHGHYVRQITDLPILEYKTFLLLKTRKFICVNPKCPQKVFSEQTPGIERYSRRTSRVNKILSSFSLEASAKQACILSGQMAVTISPSTMTRIAHSQSLPEIKPPRVLGVDDWAFRKGVRYGTVLINMETSRPIDLLPTREGKHLKQWLNRYPGSEIVTRDRAGSYAAAIKACAPQALQVADRFHLLQNLSDALDTYFKSISKEIKIIITHHQATLLSEQAQHYTPQQNITVLSGKSESDTILRPDPRQEVFSKVKELQKQQIPARKIARDLEMSRNTVRVYFHLDELPPRAHGKSTNFDSFTADVLAQLNQPGYMIKDIIRHIRTLGYNGSQTQAYYHINNLKQAKGISAENHMAIQRKKIPYIKPLSSRQLAKLIGSDLEDITDPKQASYLQVLLRHSEELQIIRRLVRMFRSILKKGSGNLRKWIDFIRRSKHRFAGLKTFANGLDRDFEAVKNGVKMSWSNGPVEGHVNRIKCIKRQMYGRASFELLRRKVILSQTG